MQTSTFTYNSAKISLDGKQFGGDIATHAGYCYEDESNTTYEAVEVNYEPLCGTIGFESFLGTLAEGMAEWGKYKPVQNHSELLILVNETLVYYGENIEEYFDADDFDDYIILLLETRDLLQNGIQFCEDEELGKFFSVCHNVDE